MEERQRNRRIRRPRATAYGDNAENDVEAIVAVPAPTPVAAPVQTGPRVWLDLDGGVRGRLVFELDNRRCPNAVSNFIFVVNASEEEYKRRQAFLGNDKTLPSPLKGTAITTVISGEVAEFGTSTTTSYWGKFFNDESLDKQKSSIFSNGKLGALSMSNAGPNTNATRFFFTLAEGQHDLDRYHECFGTLVDGFDVLEHIGSVQTDPRRGHAPKHAIHIVDCGVVDPLAAFAMANASAGGAKAVGGNLGDRRGRDAVDRDQDDDGAAADQQDEPDNIMSLAKAVKRRRGEALSHDPRFAGTLDSIAIDASGAGGAQVSITPQQALAAQQRVFEYDLLEVRDAQKHKKSSQRMKHEKEKRVAHKFEARSRNGAAAKPTKRLGYK